MATTTKSTEQWRMKASEYIQDKIVEQENRIVEMEKLMEHGKHFVAARLESHNEFGAALSMKQVMSLKEQMEEALTVIDALNDICLEIDSTPAPFDHEQHSQAVIQKRLASFKLGLHDHKHDFIEEAKKYALNHDVHKDDDFHEVVALTQHQAGGRAA